MKLLNSYKNLELICDDDLLSQIGKLAIDHYPNEFGGFLVGMYSEDLKILTIKGYILPKKYIGLPFIFERGISGLKDILWQLFIQKKQYYVGEWHSHPNGSSMYSQTDLLSMVEIEECDSVQIGNPILLILGFSESAILDFTFYLYHDNKLTPYE